MCGIHGILSLSGGHGLDTEILRKMGAVTRHRGPDDEGVFADRHLLMGMRRLSIIDVDGGHQPIANEDESVWVVCNGEIYNFRELRKQLESLGHRFSTDSDSEVIVHLYEQYGDEFVTHLQGMFGLALWDARRERFVLGRDRLGIKPLYYLIDDDRLVFASEIKAILAAPGVSRELDPVALSEYLTLGYVPGPHSAFRGIRKLPPASVLICERGESRIHEYWVLDSSIDTAMDEADWLAAVREAFEASVVAQMVSDVPLGAFLSGGIDSSSVVALMSKNSREPVRTYSIGFGGSSGGSFYNELPYARQVAEQFGTDHHEILVEPDVVSLLPKLIWHMDEPIADAAFVTTFLVSEFARQSVTVILSGVGGDELFGGYRRYLGEYYGQKYNRLPRWLRSGIMRPIAQKLPSDRHSPLMNLSRYAKSFILANELPFEDRYLAYVGVFGAAERDGLLRESPPKYRAAIERAFARSEGDALQRLLAVDLATQLPDDLLMLTDKMSMATSLECRVPLLDERLVELAARMPSSLKIRGRELKYILKRAFEGLLPREILYRQKRGFGAPMGSWLKHELAPLLKAVLSEQAISRRGLFNWQHIAETISLHEANKQDHTDHLMSLMNLELWCRIYLDGRDPEDLTAEIREQVAA